VRVRDFFLTGRGLAILCSALCASCGGEEPAPEGATFRLTFLQLNDSYRAVHLAGDVSGCETIDVFGAEGEEDASPPRRGCTASESTLFAQLFPLGATLRYLEETGQERDRSEAPFGQEGVMVIQGLSRQPPRVFDFVNGYPDSGLGLVLGEFRTISEATF